MKFEGYVVGPAIRKVRLERGLSIMEASNLTGMSTSSLNQIEQGNRSISMKTLFAFMSAYGVDANTLLDIKSDSDDGNSIDLRLVALPVKEREYLMSTFTFMLDAAEAMTV